MTIYKIVVPAILAATLHTIPVHSNETPPTTQQENFTYNEAKAKQVRDKFFKMMMQELREYASKNNGKVPLWGDQIPIKEVENFKGEMYEFNGSSPI